jgi:hypothetical protein
MISSTRLRQWHAYIGLFIAPSVLFFAATGALQIFNLHEAHGSYRPAVLLEKLSAVHKDQVFEQPHEHDAPPSASVPVAGAAGNPPADDDEDKPSASTMALKWFFLCVSIGLFCSTLIGIWMGTTQTRKKSLAWSLLVAGTLLPILLLVL